MSQNITPEDLFDFDGYERSIREMLQLNANFGKSTTDMLKHITDAQKPFLDQLKEQINLINKVNGAAKGAADALQGYEKSNKDTEETVSRQKKLQEVLNSSYDTSTKSINQLKYALDVLRGEFDKLKPTQDNYKTQQEAIAVKSKELKAAIDAQMSALKTANVVIKTVEGSYSALSKETNELRNRLKNLPDAFDKTTGAINKTNHEALELQRIIQQNDKVLKNFDASIGLHQRNVGNYSGSLLSAGKNLGGFGLALLGLDSALVIVEKLFSLISEFSRLDTALKNVTKSTQEYNQATAFLEGVANRNGQNIQVLTKNYMALTAASRGTRLEGIETQKIFLAITNAAASLQMSNDDLAGALNAVQQMMSKGSIQAEELKQQLGERLYGAFNTMAKAIGVTTAQLGEMLKKGQVTTDMLSKFADELNKLYSDKAKNNLDTMNGGLEYMKTQLSLIVKTLSETSGVQGFFSSLFTGLGDTLSAIRILVNSEEWGKLTMYMGSKLLHWNTPVVEGVERQVQIEKKISEAINKYISASQKEREQQVIDYGILMKQIDSQLSFNKAKGKNSEGLFAQLEMYDAILVKIGEINKSEKAITKPDPDTTGDKDKKKLTELEKLEEEMTKLNKVLENEIALAVQGKDFDDERLKKAIERLKVLKSTVDAIKEETELLKLQKNNLGEVKPLTPYGLATDFPADVKPFKDLSTSYSKDMAFDATTNSLAGRALIQLQGANSYKQIARLERDTFLELEDLKLKTTDKRQKERLELIKKYLNLEFEQAKNTERKKEELLQKSLEVGGQLASASFEFLATLKQRDIETLEAQKQHELDLVGNNEDAKAAITKKYAAEILELRRKQARFDKAQAAFNIGINTAQAIVRFLADPGGVPGVALSIAAGVVGALQLATVLAKPLPQFFVGTDNAPEGLAWVAEKGPELRESKGKSIYYDKPTITWLHQGDKIHTASETNKILAQNSVNQELGSLAEQARIMELRVINQPQQQQDTKAIENAIEKGFSKLPIHSTVIDEEGFRQFTKSQNSTTEYLNSKKKLG